MHLVLPLLKKDMMKLRNYVRREKITAYITVDKIISMHILDARATIGSRGFLTERCYSRSWSDIAVGQGWQWGGGVGGGGAY